MAFGATVFGSLLNARLATGSARLLPADVAERVVGGTLEPGRIGELGPRTASAVADVYSEGLSTVFLSAVPVLLIGLVLALMLKDVKLEARGQGGPGVQGAERPAAPRRG
ncbi:hypothetical protein [Streptomyces fungicidicus]|uniref:hypothetical protein n=1 Tax=Streptomyces fungicidicus TaxID=68203 RepID=UPI00292A5091|nr:hypothetical protein [Streptomyces fungicidicus]